MSNRKRSIARRSRACFFEQEGEKMNNLLIYNNYMPSKDHCMMADSLLNAMIGFDSSLTWNEGVNLLYARSIRLAFRPYDAAVVNSILEDLGDERIRKVPTYSELKTLLSDGKVAFARFGSNIETGRVAAFVARGDNLLALCDFYPYQRKCEALWIGNQEAVRQRIREMANGADNDELAEYGTTTNERFYEDTEYFRYFQPNPGARRIGDCVIRAFCAVLDETWISVVKQLAGSLSHRNLDFNYNQNFLNLLLKKDFGRLNPLPRNSGQLMTGAEFCEWLNRAYPGGDCKAFAYIGKSHVAGILPERDENDVIRYRIHDSWDSSTRTVTDAFLKIEAPASHPTVPKKLLSDIRIGTHILHPRYGVGDILLITPNKGDAIVTVQFDTGQKGILQSWMLQNCYSP